MADFKAAVGRGPTQDTIENMLRAVIIVFGTFVGGLAVYIAATTFLGIVGREPWMSIAFFASFIIVGAALALVTRTKGAAKQENLNLEQMAQRGLLVHEKCEARRAFQMEEFEDEGCQYFVELKNGSVLFLCGQYLYDYEPANGGSRARPRQFPCTEFTVLRHKEFGWVVDVNCAGTALEPECEAPPFGGDDDPPADGAIISNRSYDEIKLEMMKNNK